MTDPMQAATAAWYAVKNDTRSPSPTADPTPYIAAIVRALDGPLAGIVRDAEKWRDVGFLCNAEGVAELKRHADAAERDARRYRWIRDKQLLTDAPRFPIACPDSIASCDMRHTRTAQGADLDAAIDAALTRGEGVGNG